MICSLLPHHCFLFWGMGLELYDESEEGKERVRERVERKLSTTLSPRWEGKGIRRTVGSNKILSAGAQPRRTGKNIVGWEIV